MTAAFPPEAPAEAVLANARLVLADEVVTGSLAIRGGVIREIDPGTRVPPGAEDCGGALLIPGLIELHTDNLERHLMPRPGVRWPGPASVLAHDGELAAAGITTVFDAIRVGSLHQHGGRFHRRYARDMADHVGTLAASGLLRADHRLHLRAELCSETVLDEIAEFGAEDRVAVVSIMDHTPGERQFADLAAYRAYYQGHHGLADDEMDAFIAFTQSLSARLGAAHADGVVAAARRLGARLASHDDTTEGHVARSAALGVAFAEFPTTLAAARACRAAGIPVMMGAPNVLRGGSHSGNVSAAELAGEGLLDILSSDYVPSALLMGAMRLADLTGDLPAAVATVTRNPARAVGLRDRGEIAPGRRADLVRLGRFRDLAVVTGVWSAGRRVG